MAFFSCGVVQSAVLLLLSYLDHAFSMPEKSLLNSSSQDFFQCFFLKVLWFDIQIHSELTLVDTMSCVLRSNLWPVGVSSGTGPTCFPYSLLFHPHLRSVDCTVGSVSTL